VSGRRRMLADTAVARAHAARHARRRTDPSMRAHEMKNLHSVSCASMRVAGTLQRRCASSDIRAWLRSDRASARKPRHPRAAHAASDDALLRKRCVARRTHRRLTAAAAGRRILRSAFDERGATARGAADQATQFSGPRSPFARSSLLARLLARSRISSRPWQRWTCRVSSRSQLRL
jgi:hypothetical protein